MVLLYLLLPIPMAVALAVALAPTLIFLQDYCTKLDMKLSLVSGDCT